ncbi:MAG: DUF5115 domain-containing protein [Muribaculaceae bacterium]|nr:DUF5115 domain-containing protein [Muribaculaceae bacterium]
MKKFLYIAAMTLLLAGCSEDYKDWAEPQSNPQGAEITFGTGAASEVGLIDYALLPAGTESVKVCNLTNPGSSDTTYYADTYIILDGEEYAMTNDGQMDADVLNKYVVDHYGRATEQRDIPARVKWIMTNGKTATTMISDEFTIHVILAPLTIPDMWYLVGPGFGDGSWNNRGMEDVGVSLMPMYAVPGSINILKHVGYLAARRTFKIIHNPGESEQLSMVDGVIALNNGDGGNIRVSEAGYYEITLNTDTYEVTIEKVDIAPSVFTQIGMPGDYQGWNPAENLMNAVNTKAENHDWIVKNFTVSQPALLKFAADGTWDINWGGGEAFPVGMGTQNGDNITVAPGTYTVMFNDILGYYYFMQEE